jgi:CheY-like chemotaxis protein/HEAT repeat protein
MADYITKIKESINKSSIKKTKQLLKELKKQSFETKLEVLQIFALAPDIVALNLLPLLTQSEYIDEEIHDNVIQLIIDRAHLNFHFALILFSTANKIIIDQIVPLMKHILSNETDFEILKETIKTAGKQRIETLVDDIAEFIFYGESKLKSEAVKALERIGSNSSYDNLLKAADSSKCDQNILDSIEVFKNKGEEPGKRKNKTPIKENLLNNITSWNDKLKSKDIKTRFNVLIKLADAGTVATEIFIENLKSKNHDVIINTLGLISRTIPESLIPEVFSLLNNKKNDPEIKFAAYSALGAFPELESSASAINGANSPFMHIRTAAVKVLDKNPTDLVIATIKEKIESGTEPGRKLGESILDAHANNLINQLMVSDTFTYIISNYLEKKASFSVLENYIKVQKMRKLTASAKKCEKILLKKQNEDNLYFIILSNSQIRINIYTKILFAAGYSSKAFLHSQAAFEYLMADKPYAVICDLFLNNMTGFDFLKEIREVHSKKELPVIFSTLQKDLIDQEKNIISFPPNTNQIQYCFKQI